MKTLSLAAAFARSTAHLSPLAASGEEGPNKLDIPIVWSKYNCPGIEISDEAKAAAVAATSGMSAEDHAASAAKIEEAIASSFEGGREEYCLFISEMAFGYPDSLN